MPKALYICYFGIREPLVQTQVLPYLRELVKIEDLRMSLVTFEPGWAVAELQSYGVAKLRRELAEQGIDWHWLRYHKRLSVIATGWDILRGTVFTWRFIARAKIDLIHSRVHVPMLMAALARKLSGRKPKLLFDIRGFFPEEYTDAGIWPEGGWLYRTAKRIEKWLLKEADGFVVLTEKAREILFPESAETGRDKLGRPVEVIPCCVDFSVRFTQDREKVRPSIREEMKLDGRLVITHVGALGGLYLQDDITDFLAVAREQNPAVFAMFLTQSDPSLIVPLLETRGFDSSDYLVRRVSPSDVPKYLYASDVALSFVKPTFATQSRSPTKIPEYLACGVPIIANRGVGDVDGLIEGNRIGVLLDDLSYESYQKALREIGTLSNVAGRCREMAAKEFELQRVGGFRYNRLYSALLA